MICWNPVTKLLYHLQSDISFGGANTNAVRGGINQSYKNTDHFSSKDYNRKVMNTICNGVDWNFGI